MPSLIRTVVLVVATGFLSCCANTSEKAVAPQLPSLSSVRAGHFVSTVELDHGDLMVAPAPKTRPRISATTAQALFRAADAVDGTYRFAVLGVGLATVSVDVPAATTTSAPGTTTSVGSGTSTTTTTQPPSTTTTTTTTAAPGTTSPGAGPGPGSSEATSSSAPTATTPPTTASLPRYDRRLAWVGIAWGADCPTSAGATRLATRYVAVVIDADTGRSALAYTSASPLACSGPVLPPSITAPAELVSVPWEALGPSSTSVHVTLPACSTYFGWTEVPSPGAVTVQVVARQPFDANCGSPVTSIRTVDDVVPLGAAQAQVQHATLGPVQGLHTLAEL